MAQTNLMRADEIANGFNTVLERKYWRATIAGTRVYPEINFTSRASMVQVTYVLQHDCFRVSFSRSNAAFGDFLASIFRSMAQILPCLKAAGLPFDAPLDGTPVLRIEYGPHQKEATVYLANLGDGWQGDEPLPFKVPERINVENSLTPIDAG